MVACPTSVYFEKSLTSLVFCILICNFAIHMDFLSLIEDRSQLNYETLGELRKMVEQYPFFHQARLLYLVNLHQLRDPSFGDELRRSSVFLPSLTALFQLVEGQHYDLENTSVKSPIVTEDEDRTLSLIDNFLIQQPEEEPSEESEPHSVPTVAEVTSDYASFLAMQEEVESPVEDTSEKGGADAIIDSFLSSQEGKQRYEFSEQDDDAPQTAAPDTDFDGADLYNEKIVEILVKQRQYAQALEILRQICLNNPEKSRNFATQMQLLEIIVEQKSQK